ncbi:glycosyltransferase family 4 protein [Natrinema altunense]|uniref:Glycosyltransferase family 1 protein n=1 Tax=Natrinema altunense TaxID=222984 RepID=A0A482XYG5_9EURY|nr:glycosyltransferase family 1 protein [Natrinema altunense]RZH67024.1 glycosyltransferase family 1 protein [Natrinema altunense]
MSSVQVGINGRVLAKPDSGGVGRYTERLLSEFTEEREASSNCSVVAVGSETASTVPDGIESVGRIPDHSGFRAHIWEQVQLPLTLRSHDFDVFHTPAGQPPVLTSTPLVTTIHDISPITHPEWFSDAYAALYRLLTPLAIRTSERIITVSEFAREEIISTYPSAKGKTTAILNGVTPRDPSAAIPCDDLTSDGFLLFVGSINPRKNIRRLLKAYKQYRERTDHPYPLVLVGPDNDIFAATDLPNIDGVSRLGFVSEAKLTWLYDNAALFVFPSLYEGFGLPILEAMSVGTATLTSDCGAMSEVAGDAAHLVDPTDVDAIASGIEHVLDDPEKRHNLSQSGKQRATTFSWERTAKQTAIVYEEVAES